MLKVKETKAETEYIITGETRLKRESPRHEQKWEPIEERTSDRAEAIEFWHELRKDTFLHRNVGVYHVRHIVRRIK